MVFLVEVLGFGICRCRRGGRRWGTACLLSSAGDDMGTTTDVKINVWIREGGMYDAVVDMDEEGEVSVMEAGLLCRASGSGIVSWILGLRRGCMEFTPN